jgi:hypothetical protein
MPKSKELTSNSRSQSPSLASQNLPGLGKIGVTRGVTENTQRDCVS